MRASAATWLLAIVLGTSGLLAVTPPASAAPQGRCAAPVLDRSTRAEQVGRASPRAFAAAARANGRTSAALAGLAADDPDHLWLDRCGRAFYSEPASAAADEPGGETAAAPVTVSGTATTAAAASPAPLADTFHLASQPEASRIIYLDFTGATVTDTAWNVDFGSTITAAPYSLSWPATTTFTDDELTEIQRIWQVVAEDYAPFEVNVTTVEPTVDQLRRSSAGDQYYGVTVVVTSSGPIFSACGCGGLAYVDVFSEYPDNLDYAPAWVFTSGTGPDAKGAGEAASHEAGHTFGLDHDGKGSTPYYEGASPWAPIMGVGYYQPVTQFSAGDYVGATSAQNDLALIAGHVPVRADDHADSWLDADLLTTAEPVEGLITTRADTDAFVFTAAGATTLTVTPTSPVTNLDVALTILDADGTPVLPTINPPAIRQSASVATGMGATWSVDLPAVNADYAAVVDGGAGPTSSDYGSLGGYTISLITGATPEAGPLQVEPGLPPPAEVGSAVSGATVTVSGGTRPYRYAATGLPSGLSMHPVGGGLAGVPSVPGTFPVTVEVTDAVGATATTSVELTVAPAPLVVVTGSIAGLRQGTSVSRQLSVTGGVGGNVWAADGPVPPGLVLSPSGVLSGTPTTPGSYALAVSVRSGEAVASRTISVPVDWPVLRFTTGSRLRTARRGRAYAVAVTVAGGRPSYSWRKVSGTLPRGLRLAPSATRLVLKGRATRAGRFRLRVRVTDARGLAAYRTFQVVVRR